MLLALIVMQAATEPSQNIFSLSNILGGGITGSVVAAIIFVIKLLFDRGVPTRADARANTQLVLEGLNNLVKILQADKQTDADALARKQARIDELETAADKDYDRIRELRAEILDLQNRLAQKNRHIDTLVTELRRVGRTVTGLELDDLTFAAAEVRRISAGGEPQTGPTSVTTLR